MVGDSRPERVLIAASFVNRVGNGLFNAASALYFTLVVGLPAAQVGAALTIAGVIGLCAGIPGGHLADRRGARTIMMLALAVQAMSMAALVLVELDRAYGHRDGRPDRRGGRWRGLGRLGGPGRG